MMDGSESEETQLEKSPIVFFDLETTGLGCNCEIIQLAAVSGGHSLNLYVVPQCQIQRGATKVTGFSVYNKNLYLHRQLVFTNSLKEVLISFIAFVEMLGHPLLIGHNIRRFDCPVLLRALDKLDLRVQFESSISGCVDTLPLAREMLQKNGLQSFRQEHLVRELLGMNYKAHNALEDVRALQTLFSYLQPAPEVIQRHRFTLGCINNNASGKTGADCKKPKDSAHLDSLSRTVKPTEDHNEEVKPLVHPSS